MFVCFSTEIIFVRQQNWFKLRFIDSIISNFLCKFALLEEYFFLHIFSCFSTMKLLFAFQLLGALSPRAFTLIDFSYNYCRHRLNCTFVNDNKMLIQFHWQKLKRVLIEFHFEINQPIFGFQSSHISKKKQNQKNRNKFWNKLSISRYFYNCMNVANDLLKFRLFLWTSNAIKHSKFHLK